MNINRDKTVALTGYNISQILKTSSELHLLTDLLARLSDEVKKLYDSGYTTFMSGMNEGYEIMAADMVIHLREQCPNIELVAVIPYLGHESLYSSPDKYRYKRILGNADKTVVISKIMNESVFPKLNDFMFKNCSHLLCYCNGQSYQTEMVYDAAIKANMPIVNLCKDDQRMCES